MRRVALLFGVHAHQPVGNFPWVMEEAFQKCYRPFFEAMGDYPEFHFSAHFTGPLLLWLQEHHPEFLEMLRQQVAQGTLELVVSGFYEPVLAAIPEKDRIAQIQRAQEYLKLTFGATAVGLWLTERVWESEVVLSLLKTGIRYVVVDDYHFLAAGLPKERLYGYYLTEAQGQTLAIFPIDETLRYLTPFRPVEETLRYLERVQQQGGQAAVIFDDLEKFGVWPGTAEWVYEKGWLRRFIEAVLENPFVQPMTYWEYFASFPPLGRIYLPTASYFEMGEWSLPAESAEAFLSFIGALKEKGLWEQGRRFVRGGIWRNFLVKYEESNYLHKKMLLISREIDRTDEEAVDALLRAQCNDVYWHGVFGGLYLPHLRRETYRNLLRAERTLVPREGAQVRVLDLDCDGRPEVYIRTPDLVVCVAPARGGALRELSLLSVPYNLNDTLTRRFEHYHRGIRVGPPEGEGVASIHEIAKVVDERTYRALRYDPWERWGFLDHIVGPEAGLAAHREGAFPVRQSFAEVPFEVVEVLPEGVRLRGETQGAFLEKTYQVGRALAVGYRGGGFPEEALFLAVELNFSMPSSDHPEGKVWAEGIVLGSFRDEIEREGLEAVAMEDPSGLQVELRASHPFTLWAYPVYTVSQSEAGFDTTYQETCLILRFPLTALKDGLEIRLEEIRA